MAITNSSIQLVGKLREDCTTSPFDGGEKHSPEASLDGCVKLCVKRSFDETDNGVLSETLEPENLIDQTEQGF